MQYLEQNELLRVLSEAKKKSARDFCLILMSYRHGLRESEAAALTLDSVRGGKIDVKRLKGSLHTIQPLYTHENPLLDEKKALAAWLRERGDADGSQLLFISRQGSGLSRRQIYNIFEDIAFKAGIEVGRRNPHILKHSLASHLIRNGVGIENVRIALGHKDLKATACYLNLTDAEVGVVVDAKMRSIYA